MDISNKLSSLELERFFTEWNRPGKINNPRSGRACKYWHVQARKQKLGENKKWVGDCYFSGYCLKKKKSTFTWSPVWERGNIFQLECKVLNVWGCVVLFPWASFSIWELAFLPSPWDHGQKCPFFTVMSVGTSVEEKTAQILYQWIAWAQLTQG